MSDLDIRPSKRAKLSHTPKPLENPSSQCKPADLIAAIPPPPDYEPLPLRNDPRQPIVELPLHANNDPYSLFTLFLTEAHFETIATNTNRYAESKGAIM
jgi:hypothetical protein